MNNNPNNNGNGGGPRPNRPKDIGFYVVILVILLSTIFILMSQGQSERGISYAEIRKQFINENVKYFVLENGNLQLTLKEKWNGQERITHKLYSDAIFYSDLGSLFEDQHDRGVIADYDFIPSWETPWWLTFIPYLIILAAFMGFWYFMMNREMGGGKGGGANNPFRFGRARTRDASKDKKRITFADVASAVEEKEELKEIVDFLKEPKRFTEMGARIPKGVLLVGPPGTGKTYLAKAVAGEAGVQFLSISGSDFVELYVGVGASRVRDLFDQAKKAAPSIVFIDEIDAVGRQRGAGLGGGHDEREQTLNQLLVEMDGFGTNEGVIVMAATNRQDILDRALLRPGRFDRTVYVGLPDIKGREEILKIHSKDKRLSESVSLRKIAQITAGFTPADLENLMNEAALHAARNANKFITMPDVEEAMIKVIAGPAKRSKVLTDKEKRDTAVHEAGHAIAMQFLEHTDNVHQISIIPRGQALGMTIHLPEQDKNSMFKNEMLDEIVALLGGRTAERLVLKDITTGASNDLQRATATARNMVMRYGMSELLGPVTFSNENNEVFIGRDFAQSKPYSEAVATQIDEEVKRIIGECDVRCEKMLREHANILEKTVKYLLENEVMDGSVFKYLCEHKELPSDDDFFAPPGGGVDVTVSDDFTFNGISGEASPA